MLKTCSLGVGMWLIDPKSWFRLTAKFGRFVFDLLRFGGGGGGLFDGGLGGGAIGRSGNKMFLEIT